MRFAVALWAGRAAILAIAFAIGTWTLGWWAIPVLAATAAVIARSVARLAGAAALAAAMAWAGLLAWSATHGSVWAFAGIVGGAMGVSRPVLILMTLAFPAALAWSAASVAQHLTRGNPVTP